MNTPTYVLFSPDGERSHATEGFKGGRWDIVMRATKSLQIGATCSTRRLVVCPGHIAFEDISVRLDLFILLFKQIKLISVGGNDKNDVKEICTCNSELSRNDKINVTPK